MKPLMEVLDHEPYSWFLLRAGRDYLLDVNCTSSFVGFGVLIRLSDDERNDVKLGGHQRCVALATAIQNQPQRFDQRNLSGTLSKEITDAIDRWRANGTPAAQRPE